MEDLSKEKINALRKNARSVIRELGLLNDAYFEIGVTLAERHLLLELADSKEPITAKEVAERLFLDKSTVSRLVAKAVKKGLISSAKAKKDKRRHFLQFTDLGKKTLLAFEPIAFDHTKHALETLSSQEIDFVCRGVALYAKGLQNFRLQKDVASAATKNSYLIDSLKSIYDQLEQLGYKIEPYHSDEEEELFSIFKEVIDTGNEFLHQDCSFDTFHSLFFGSSSKVYVCRSLQGHVIGGFYVKSNYPGKASHIANAAYMIQKTHRGLGIGTLLIKASLHIAKELGFLAMQFNMVLSENTRAIQLYKTLGFEITGITPNAAQNLDKSFQDGYSMYRKLNNL